MSGEHYIEGIINKLRAVDDFETKILDSGTILIGKRKNRSAIDPLYLNTVFGPLNDEGVARLEVRIERKLPHALRNPCRLPARRMSWDAP